MRLALGITKPRNPILGLVFAGEIESVGKDVKRFKSGDQVFGFTGLGFGSYAEYKCMSEDGILAVKPVNMTYEEAAVVPYGGLIAFYNLSRGSIQKGQKVLVYGASGAIGTAAVQIAKSLGAEVTGVCSTANLDLVKSLGADEVIDYTKQDSIDTGQLYDLVLDAVGKHKSSKLKLACEKALAPNGKYLSVDDGVPRERVEHLVQLKEFVEAGCFRAAIDRRFPLEEMVEAHRYVDKGHKKGNVIINVAQ